GQISVFRASSFAIAEKPHHQRNKRNPPHSREAASPLAQAAKRQALSRKPRSGKPSRASREAASPLAPVRTDDQECPSFEFSGSGSAGAPPGNTFLSGWAAGAAA